jgi:hypothetical protein
VEIVIGNWKLVIGWNERPPIPNSNILITGYKISDAFFFSCYAILHLRTPDYISPITSYYLPRNKKPSCSGRLGSQSEQMRWGGAYLLHGTRLGTPS